MKIWFYVVVHAFARVIFPSSGYQDKGCGDTGSSVKWVQKARKAWVHRYLGEWWIADCRVENHNVTATLLEKRSGQYKNMTVDGHHLKLINNNMYNFTNVSNDYVKRDYYCEACGQKKKVGEIGILETGKAFEYPKITNKPDGPVEFNQTMNLVCEISMTYALRWYKDGKEFNVPPTYLRPKLQKILTIKNYNGTIDDGVYSCVAERKVVNWRVQDEVRLLMRELVKPTFGNVSEYDVISLKENDILHRELQATGYPKPDVHCKQKNTKPKKQYFKTNGNSVTIHISKLKYSLHRNASFQCIAKNVKGSATWNISLNIWVKPKLETKGDTTITMDTNKTGLTLLCKVAEANPLATVHWSYSDDNEQTWSPIAPNVAWLAQNKEENNSTLRLNEQKIYKMFYKCVANNRFGEDVITWKVLSEASLRQDRLAGTDRSNDASYMTAIIITSSVVGVLVLCVVVILYRRKKALGGFYLCTLPPYRDYISILDENRYIHEQTHKLPYMSEWEFPRGNIVFHGELGSGAFGVVYYADAVGMTGFLIRRNALKDNKPQRRFSFTRFKKRNFSLSTNDCDVVKTAVKTLKADYSPDDLADILSELKVLIHVGEHENVLRILGACTKVAHNEAPLLILEYCPHGNLKEFLRTRRAIYEPEWKDVDNVRLSITDIVKFALHIAKGMEFLISRKCIHRDLAARNVLVSDGYVAKISDFGLARDVYNSLEYVKVTPGLLPIKWMAIEAIQDRIFNEKTDVWSYGIVLWELFTLGGTPYPDLDPSVVLHTLQSGKRMSPPMHCPEEMSSVMLSCWSKDPLERPSFADIVWQLEKLFQFPDIAQEASYQNFP